MEQVFKHFNMTPNPSIQTPLNDNLDVLIDEEESGRATIKTVTTDFQYREKLESLLYYMIVMRPDLMYTVHMLSKRPSTRVAASLTRAYHMRTIHAQ